MWTYVVVAAAKDVCQQIRRRFVDSLSDEQIGLFYVLEVLQAATGLADGTLQRGPAASYERIERTLCRALCEGAKVLDGSDPVLAVYADTFEYLTCLDLPRQREILERVAEELLEQAMDRNDILSTQAES